MVLLKFCKIDSKTPVLKSVVLQALQFHKKETPVQVFSCECYENFDIFFIEHFHATALSLLLDYCYYLKHQIFEFFCLPFNFPMFNYWSFISLCLCFCPTY